MTTPFPPYQPHPQPYPPQWTATPHVIRGDRNSMGTAGLVLAIVGLAFAVIPILGMIAWVIWPLGTIFSGIGIARCNQGVATNRNNALAGMIVSLTAAVVCMGWVWFTVYASASGAAHQH